VRLYGDKLTNANVVDDDRLYARPFPRLVSGRRLHRRHHQAVLARRPTRPADFDARMKAVSHFRSGRVLCAGGGQQACLQHPGEIRRDAERHRSRFGAERSGGNQAGGHLVVLRDKLQPYFAAGRYQDALIELAALREPVDEFFENVMVNAEDKDVRINRLTLLSKLRELFLQVADISLLQ
jgi:glycyl-tRNA synthetase beta chain